MTEKEAWLELAKTYEPGSEIPTAWFVPHGICHGVEYIVYMNPVLDMEAMKERLQIFSPNHDDDGDYYWGDGGWREERAMACGLLAEMCND